MKALHEKAKFAVRKFLSAEYDLISVLIEIDACKGYREMKYTSLSGYCNGELDLSEYHIELLITTCRKCVEIPELREALRKQELTIYKTKALLSILTPENQAIWLKRAKQYTKREVEDMVAAERGRVPMVHVKIPRDLLDKIKHAQDLACKGEALDVVETLNLVLDEYIARHDPVAKAQRRRAALPGEGKTQVLHQVAIRDQARCQFKMPSGRICGSRRWRHVHHIKHREHGGKDTLENLTTLCSAHHRMLHRNPENIHLPKT